jgi:hypothetical protein
LWSEKIIVGVDDILCLYPSPESSVPFCDKLMKDTIEPALLASLWCQEPTRSKITKNNYCRIYPWPIREYLFWRLSKSIIKVNALEIYLNDPSEMSTLLETAQQAIRTLSEVLDKNDYFGGEKPIYIDARIYAILSIACTILPKHHKLRVITETCTNLARFISRIQTFYFNHN